MVKIYDDRWAFLYALQIPQITLNLDSTRARSAYTRARRRGDSAVMVIGSSVDDVDFEHDSEEDVFS